MDDPPPLAYGSPDKQLGVITERLPNGGVTLTVPYAKGFLGHDNLVENVLRKAFHQFPHRAVLTLDRTGFTVVQPTNHPNAGDVGGAHRAHYPFAGLGEIRKNRYSRGVYVSVTGQDNFDLLIDVDERVVHFISDILEQTLAALRRS